MCLGEKRRLHIPTTLAYGKVGDNKNVPPGADLIYDVEVVSGLGIFSSGLSKLNFLLFCVEESRFLLKFFQISYYINNTIKSFQ